MNCCNPQDACEWVSFCPADKGAGKGKGKKGGRDDGYLAALFIETPDISTLEKPMGKNMKTHVTKSTFKIEFAMPIVRLVA